MSDQTSQDKTEQATDRKLKTAREKGQIAYSGDFVSGTALMVATIGFWLLGDSMLTSMNDVLKQVFMKLHLVAKSDSQLGELSNQAFHQSFMICLPVILITFLASLSVGGLLTGFQLSPKALATDFEKLNPTQGFKKIFSFRAVMRGFMSLFKVIVVSLIVYQIVKQQFDETSLTQSKPIGQSIKEVWDLVVLLLAGVSAGLVLLGIGDLAFQKWKHSEDMKMSRQEVVDERKEDEGDPHLKARMKRLQREVSLRNLANEVAASTVVITNPTHFAVCLKYDRTMSAPQVVAKGHDAIAFRIIELAKSNKVAVVQRPPLARALYHHANVGSEIPIELYQAVAEVMSFIQSMDRQLG